MKPESYTLTASIKEMLERNLNEISLEAHQLASSLNTKDHCLLCDFEEMYKLFIDIQSVASSYYLQQYLSPFTSHHPMLSIAIHHMSERYHGALIIIERDTNLDIFIQRGIPIEAPLNSLLLEAIFYPGNPLHDGAVLIRGNHIVSAANVLPLSSIAVTNKKLGTRHRAAIGLSEQTDALVLVVSEETGRISFALDGTLYPINSLTNRIQ
ncbi:sporulation-specific diadenylate cyclase CdaS [Priestia koreensis]|uniref:sporulation-specific diadenylate cyclase CdaS n=1 Tax=Priestia koreensis TaxID=284581 RepID=UPI001F5984CE|nr:sporulation-specific diadenylate cyclase CdaS [Priestia koreensis]MCM3004390.1 sporulation-specific diadenylate cyclase CdaS [Priestia koreensis]UNL84607.1 DNA integrity scanning protein DisA nucleotide-binding domain protein [Priestia koreensis]